MIPPVSIAFMSGQQKEGPSFPTKLDLRQDDVFCKANVTEFHGESMEGLERRIRELHCLLAKAAMASDQNSNSKQQQQKGGSKAIYTVIDPAKPGPLDWHRMSSTLSGKSEHTTATVMTSGSVSINGSSLSATESVSSRSDDDDSSWNQEQREQRQSSTLARTKSSFRADLDQVLAECKRDVLRKPTTTTSGAGCQWGYFVDVVEEAAPRKKKAPPRKAPHYRNFLKKEIERAPLLVGNSHRLRGY